jgi:hypothetical protein
MLLSRSGMAVWRVVAALPFAPHAGKEQRSCAPSSYHTSTLPLSAAVNEIDWTDYTGEKLVAATLQLHVVVWICCCAPVTAWLELACNLTRAGRSRGSAGWGQRPGKGGYEHDASCLAWRTECMMSNLQNVIPMLTNIVRCMSHQLFGCANSAAFCFCLLAAAEAIPALVTCTIMPIVNNIAYGKLPWSFPAMPSIVLSPSLCSFCFRDESHCQPQA